MTRIEEMKKYGYTLVIYGLDKQVFARYEHVGWFGRYHNGEWIIYDLDGNVMDEFNLKEFYDYSILTKNR